MSLLKPTLNLFLFSFAFGGSAFYSYVASPIAFKVLDRESFSTLQHKMLPIMFKLQVASPLLLLGLNSPKLLTPTALTSLAFASISGAVNLFWLLPRTQRIKQERRKIAKELKDPELERADAPLRMEFGKAHGISLFFNVTHVIALAMYGRTLSKSLIRYMPK